MKCFSLFLQWYLLFFLLFIYKITQIPKTTKDCNITIEDAEHIYKTKKEDLVKTDNCVSFKSYVSGSNVTVCGTYTITEYKGN